MSTNSVLDKLQKNVSKPCFWKSLSPGENWKSKSMRIIPEEFVRSTSGAFEHRVVFTVRWENSWQLWLEEDGKDLFMIEEDWDEFVDDNHLGPNDHLFLRHDNTMYLEVQIFKNDGDEIISAPLGDESDTETPHPKPQIPDKKTTPIPQSPDKKTTPIPQSPDKKTTPIACTSTSAEFPANRRTGGLVTRGCATVKNPEQYLLNPENPYFVQAVTKRNTILYVSRPTVYNYGLKFGPVESTINYLLPGERVEKGKLRIYSGNHAFSGWSSICRRYNLKIGDSVVCELERSGGLVTAVRVHFVNE